MTPESWDELLEKRRRERLEGGGARPKQEPAKPASHPVSSHEGLELELDAAARAELESNARQLQLFAYPADRRWPWAVMCLMAASGSFTLGMAMYWKRRVCAAPSLEELQPRVQAFADALGACTVSRDGLLRGELHRLLLASILQAGNAPARVLTDASILVCCGTLVERLHGPGFLLSLVGGSAIMCNGLALLAHERCASHAARSSCAKEHSSAEVSITSTSGGVVALGVFCGLRYGRWALWPGLPVPVAWILAPLLVADAVTGRYYMQRLLLYWAETGQPDPEAAPTTEATEPSDRSSGLHLAVALGACEGVAERARAECRQAPDDVASWQEDLERRIGAAPPLPPDGVLWADVFGVAMGAVVALLMRQRI